MFIDCMTQLETCPGKYVPLVCYGNQRVTLMAGTDGFEPSHHGTKNHCLTAWLRPKCQIIIAHNTSHEQERC